MKVFAGALLGAFVVLVTLVLSDIVGLSTPVAAGAAGLAAVAFVYFGLMFWGSLIVGTLKTIQRTDGDLYHAILDAYWGRKRQDRTVLGASTRQARRRIARQMASAHVKRTQPELIKLGYGRRQRRNLVRMLTGGTYRQLTRDLLGVPGRS